MRIKKLTELIGVKFDPGTFKLIKEVADLQGVGACDFIRLATRRELARLGYLPDEERKALGVE